MAGCHTFSLPHRQQAVLIAVAERTLGYRLKVPGVNPAAGDGVAALTHAGVVAQTALVQVRVGEGIAARNPLGLERRERERLKDLSTDPDTVCSFYFILFLF